MSASLNADQLGKARAALVLAALLVGAIGCGPRDDEDSPYVKAARVLGKSSAALTNGILSAANLGIDDDVLEIVMKEPTLPNLRDVTLDDNQIGPGGIAALVRSPRFVPTSLFLSGNPLGDEGAAVLASTPAFAGICGFRQFWHRFSENSGTARAWGLVSSNGGTVEDDEPAVMQSAVEDRSCEVGVV